MPNPENRDGALPETVADASQAAGEIPTPADHDLALRDPSRYRIDGVQGHGGIGWVLRVRDLELGRVLALKELINRSAAAESRFEREIRLTARLEHPGIVPVHDAGRWATDGRAFYTMKLVAGASLKETLANTTSLDERLALVPHLLAIAEAVAYAHSRGIIHRDLKPANVVLGEYGETIVIDWGLAKEVGAPELLVGDEPVAAGTADLTVAGTVMGTPSFMSPEQAVGADVDVRTDVYAIGAIAYCLLSGRAPYEAPSSTEVLRQLTDGPPLPLRQREPGVPVDLAAIVEKAMSRDPDARYPNARALAVDLRRYQTGRFVEARQHAWWEPTLRWVRRHAVVVALTATFVILGVVGAVVTVQREQGLRQVAEAERARAESQTVALLEQQGRRDLEAGHPRRAAVSLAEALIRDPSSQVRRTLLSEAMRPFRAHDRTFTGHDRDVVAVAFSPDGRWLASGSTDQTVRIWPVAGDDPGSSPMGGPRILVGHEDGVETVAWSRDGTLLATGGGKTLRVWRAADGVELHAWPGGGGFDLSFSPDGTELWIGEQSGDLRILDVQTGREVQATHPHDDRIANIVFDPTGRRGYTLGWDGRLIEWDTRTHRTLRTIEGQSSLRFLSFDADGRLALTGEEDGTVCVRDGVTLAPLHTLHLPTASHATRGWFGLDGRTFLTASADGALRVWHATSGVVLQTLDTVVEGKVFDASFSPDGAVAIASLRDVDLWRPSVDADYRVFEGGDYSMTEFHPGALSADGRLLAASRMSDGPAWVQSWDTATGDLVARWEAPGNPYTLVLVGDGGRMVVGDLVPRAPATLRDTRTGALLSELTGHSRIAYNVAISQDRRTVATASYDQTVRLWNAETAAPIGPVITFDVRPTAVAFDPVAPRLAIALEDGTVALHDRESGARLTAFTAHATWIQDIEFSADGGRLVTAGRQDHLAKIWDLRHVDAAPIVLSGHADNLMRAEFSPDGTQVATASVDDSARLWEASTGELLRTIAGPSYTVAFSPDGGELYTTGARDYVVAWRLGVDPRPADQLAAEVAEESPWVLAGGRVVPRP